MSDLKTEKRMNKKTKISQIDNIDDPEVDHQRLNLIDIDRGYQVPHEAECALLLESMEGFKLERSTSRTKAQKRRSRGSGDFIIVTGPHKDKMVDIMYSADERQKPFLNDRFSDNFFYGYQIIHHLYKCDFVALDFRSLTAANREIVEAFLNSILKKEDRDRVFIVNDPVVEVL